MTIALKSYPSIKASGVEWLGDVPKHWSLMPPKRVLRAEPSGTTIIKNTASSDHINGYVPAFSASGQDIWLPAASHYGDALVLSAVGARCGKTFRTNGDWAVVANTQVLRPDKTQNRDFWWYITNTPDWWERAGAAQPFVKVKDTLNRMWVLPPLPEQTAIVRYLDHVDERIRRYISGKEKLIRLLEEEKKAVINQAVTGQVDVCTGQPYPAYKPSGVEWLGDVPAHWEVRRLKQVSWVQGGFAYSTDLFGNKGVPVIRMNNIHRGALNFDNVVRIPEHKCKDAFALKEGDIIYGLSGSIGATGSLGNYAVVRNGDTPAQLNQRIARFQPSIDRIISEFLVGSLQTSVFYEQVLSHTTGTAQFNVSTNDIGNVALALPPVDEQQQIVCHISTATAKIDTALDRARRQIELLQEYRTRLIADVVTGKLDVREAAISLRDEIAERELRDEEDGRANGEDESSDEVIIETAEIAVERTEDI